MDKDEAAKNGSTDEILVRILDEVQACSGYLKATAESTAKTATNTRNVRQDIRAIREGKTGPGSLKGIDPLSRPKREEVRLYSVIYQDERDESRNLYVTLKLS